MHSRRSQKNFEIPTYLYYNGDKNIGGFLFYKNIRCGKVEFLWEIKFIQSEENMEAAVKK